MDAGVIIKQLAESFVFNGRLFAVTLLFGLPLGLIVSFGSMSRFKPLSWLTKTFVWIIRGTPLMLQLYIIFFVPNMVSSSLGLGIRLWPGMSGRFWAAAVAFIINYACYFSEIYRGGIESIPVGQQEAGQVLGMTKSQIFFKVTLLQVVKRIVPPMGNEVITLVKDTSLANVISNVDIIFKAKEFNSAGLIWPLFATGVFFLAAVGILTLLLGYAERRLSYFR
jgi:polar amino acid transport system permease protein